MEIKVGGFSPWGSIQEIDAVADGISFVTTASHGGFHLSGERQEQFRQGLPSFEPFTGSTQWMEEDCDSAAVILSFPAEFSAKQHLEARRAARMMSRRMPQWQKVCDAFGL